MKKIILAFAIYFPMTVFSQIVSEKINIRDLNNFWIAYDSIQKTNDRNKKVLFLNDLYLNKASEGLSAFLKNKDNISEKYVSFIDSNSKSLENLRFKMPLIEETQKKALKNIEYFLEIYPELKDTKTYFIIGFGQQGGTIRNNISIIGTEVALRNESDIKNLNHLIIHEYVHTQQERPDFKTIDVLTSSIREGACDFVAELITKEKYRSDYLVYGEQHESEIWSVFKNDRFTKANDLWVSTGQNPMLPARDLGYFVGYRICKHYYDNSIDKKTAIEKIIQLNYADPNAIRDFLDQSGYEKSFKKKILKLKNEGYKKQGNNILFSFDQKKTFFIDDNGSPRKYDILKDGIIESVKIIGNVSSQKKELSLSKNKKGIYTLLISNTQLKPNESFLFRFLINEKYEVIPNFAIGNRTTDSNGKTFLTVK